MRTSVLWLNCLYLLFMAYLSDTQMCYKPVDIILLLDSSGSIKDHEWRKQVSFGEKLCESFNISSNASRVGLIYFGDYAYGQIDLNSEEGADNDSIINNFERIKSYTRYQNITRTDLALYMAVNMFLGVPKDRKVPKVLVIITDGVSSKGMQSLSQPLEMLRRLKVVIISVGIGLERLPVHFPLIAAEELKYMASSKDLCFQIENFDHLLRRITKLREYVCPRICRRPVDLIVALDKSGSVKDQGWKDEVNFVKKLLKHFTISENGTHLGVIPFGERAESPVDLSKNGMNLSKITDSLQELEHTWKDPFARTFTHLGLRKTVHMFKRSKRSVPKLFIIVTDGRSSLPRKLHGPLKKLKKMNVITFSIGVWGYDSKELLLMANNKVDRVFEIDNFPSLVNVIVKITQVICNKQRDHGNLITGNSFSVCTAGVLKNSKFYWDTIIYILVFITILYELF